MGSVHSSGAEEAPAAADSSCRPGGFWEHQAAAERDRMRRRSSSQRTDRQQQHQQAEVELQEVGQQLGQNAGQQVGQQAQLQRRRQLIPRARLATSWTTRHHRHQHQHQHHHYQEHHVYQDTYHHHEHQGWPETEEQVEWVRQSPGTHRALGRRLSFQTQPQQQQRRHRSVGDLSQPCRSLPLDADLSSLSSVQPLQLQGRAQAQLWRSELQLCPQPQRARARRLHRQFALYQVTPADNNFDYLRRFHSSGEVAGLGGVDEARPPPADDCSATSVSVSTCSGSGSISLTEGAQDSGSEWGAQGGRGDWGAEVEGAAGRGQAGSRASSSSTTTSSSTSSAPATGRYLLHGEDSQSDGEQRDASGNYLTISQNLEPDSESEAELAVSASEAEEEEVEAEGDDVAGRPGRGCCTLTRRRNSHRSGSPGDTSRDSSGQAEAADPTGGGPHQEQEQEHQEEEEMSRRPQVLRVTDSPNSVLSPRRSPTSPPPAVVATLTTCSAVATPPLDASALCLHAEAPGTDAAYRVVTCKDAESTPLQCGSHSLDRRARLGLHRSVPGCLDTVDSSAADSGADSSQPLDAALDGLARYLQSNRQGLRELLLSSGLVVVQPLPASPHRSCRIAGATVKANTAAAKAGDPAGACPPSQQAAPQPAVERAKSYTIPRALRFFHPKRHNRELLDEELPDPETVRRARQVFEASLAASTAPAPTASAPAPTARRALSAPGRRWTDCGSVSSGVSSDLSSSYEAEARSFRGSDDSDRASADDDDDDDDDEEDAGRGGSPTGEARVSGEVLERIRARGLSVTYYGGRVVASTGAPPPVAAVLSEIGKGTARNGGTGGFRLVKSHSCGSRLQLAGGGHGEELKESRVFTSTLGDVSLRKDTGASRQLADYCYAGRDLPATRRYPDMEFEEFQVLEEGAGVQGQRGAVCGAA